LSNLRRERTQRTTACKTTTVSRAPLLRLHHYTTSRSACTRNLLHSSCASILLRRSSNNRHPFAHVDPHDTCTLIPRLRLSAHKTRMVNRAYSFASIVLHRLYLLRLRHHTLPASPRHLVARALCDIPVYRNNVHCGLYRGIYDTGERPQGHDRTIWAANSFMLVLSSTGK
jgi:hypothetical protein